MERGLLWLPLLVTFIVLVRLGWGEYRKIAAYEVWAQDFDQAKYDILGVLGYRQGQLTYGIPDRQGPRDLQTIALDRVEGIELWIDGQPIAEDQAIPKGKRISLQLITAQETLSLPFTEYSLAEKWRKFLLKNRDLPGQSV